MSTTLDCALAQWSPVIGDNTPVGWLTVAVYLLAGVAAIRAGLSCDPRDRLDRRERLFWRISAVVLLFLAVNKQLDLQNFGTAVARCHAQLTGWYETRRDVQRLFVFAVAGVGLAGMVVLAISLRGVLGRVWLALLGLGFVCLFVVIRAASFHHMDRLIGTPILGLRINWLLELPGPLLVLVVALHRMRSAKRLAGAQITNQD